MFCSDQNPLETPESSQEQSTMSNSTPMTAMLAYLGSCSTLFIVFQLDQIVEQSVSFRSHNVHMWLPLPHAGLMYIRIHPRAIEPSSGNKHNKGSQYWQWYLYLLADRSQVWRNLQVCFVPTLQWRPLNGHLSGNVTATKKDSSDLRDGHRL